MKLRIKGNTLRLRLSQREVADFAAGSEVSETLTFPGGVFLRYAIRMETAQNEAVVCRMEDACLMVATNAGTAQAWAGTDQVGFEAILDNGTEKGLFILVEKDFKCLTPRAAGEDEDSFPNPEAAHNC